MPKQPIAEVFGFSTNDRSPEADRHRTLKLCPYNNKVPNCTKDKANAPLGVCTINDGEEMAITCPVRFRENWQVAEDAAKFFFPTGASWTSLTEVKLKDKNGNSAGNIDIVLVSYDNHGHLIDFGALEIQAVYISGNIRRPFEQFLSDPNAYRTHGYSGVNSPRADYLSSSRKRLAPQLIYKGGILNTWGKKQAVAVHAPFMGSLPTLEQVQVAEAQMAWLVYTLKPHATSSRLVLTPTDTKYTRFSSALQQITSSEAGALSYFEKQLQEQLDKRLDDGEPLNAPDAPTLDSILEQ